MKGRVHPASRDERPNRLPGEHPPNRCHRCILSAASMLLNLASHSCGTEAATASSAWIRLAEAWGRSRSSAAALGSVRHTTFRATGNQCRPLKASCELSEGYSFGQAGKAEGRAGCTAAHAGTRTITRKPPRSLSSIMISPPWLRAMSRAIERPRPVPLSS